MKLGKGKGIISIFARHPVAANLLMLIMLFSGAWALTQLNTQFLPQFNVNYITVRVVWDGASAEDVETSIVDPLEQELRNVDFLKEMTSNSTQGSGSITLEYDQGTNMTTALEQVRERVSLVRNLPQGSEEPVITKEENFENIAKLVLTGPQNLAELRPLVHNMEQELLDAGIAKVEVEGLPELEVAIQVPSAQLSTLNMSLNDIAKRVSARSRDLPAGTIGRSNTARQLRALQQRREIKDFEEMPFVSDVEGRLLRLGDIATIELRPQESEVEVFYKDKPAVQLAVFRTETADALKAAKILKQYIKRTKPSLPEGVQLHVYDQTWRYIKQRINLLLKNGAGGFILIVALLFFLLNRRVATWVAMGIPVSFMAAIFVLHMLGGSINMVSLFALIMTLGIIVDDTIVVGEESLTLLNQGRPVIEAVELGAKRMLAPVMASSITTICAFLPLLLIGDIIGTILKAIPIVVICVIIASIIECFLVLPGHLYHSFRNIQASHSHPLRESIDAGFARFRDKKFRPFVRKAIRNRSLTICIAVASLLLGFGLIAGGRVNFNFFPSPDGNMIKASVQFMAGSSPETMQAFMGEMQRSLDETNLYYKKLEDRDIVETDIIIRNKGAFLKGKGEQFSSMDVELIEPDDRDVRNDEFIAKWRENIQMIPEVESLIIQPPRSGPPGKDIDIQLTGKNINNLKQAALALANTLYGYNGVTDIEDDLPFGQEQLIYSLTPRASALGLTIDNIGSQLRSAFTGSLAQIYNLPNEEIEVRVMLPDEERHSLTTLEKLPIIGTGGERLTLGDVLTLDSRRGFDVIRHTDTKQTIHVTARVNPQVTNTNKIMASLEKSTLPTLTQQYNINYYLAGKSEEQKETLNDMKYGMMLAVVLIYIVLAWVFSSYAWPFVVMIAIPLGLVGAIFGHWVMGHDLTILSLFGFFGLSGIVINDSIILLTRYKELKAEGMHPRRAIVEASCQRLRAVLLTSLTTIAGLTPLLFETSLQAQFLIPMAISISFGLAFATLLILVVIPAILSIYEDFHLKRQKQLTAKSS
ncbi:MAG: acriflavin resistance protein [Legionellales bacterium]|nr:acriflavin resistance protein [Legionellales bacterium]|tara:strand:- start:36945 stop:40067 length:3123 start_codon:yes stop_codon:yes gene_type:complete